MPTEVEVAWFAGILEGEGCFSIMRYSRRGGKSRDSLRVFVQMTDRDVIERAAKIGEATTPPRCRKPQKAHWTPGWYCLWSGAHAERVMRMVLPYMGERRSAAIQEALSESNLSHHAFNAQEAKRA
jgi:hypothetical protein